MRAANGFVHADTKTTKRCLMTPATSAKSRNQPTFLESTKAKKQGSSLGNADVASVATMLTVGV
jgi:hypothetical protein